MVVVATVVIRRSIGCEGVSGVIFSVVVGNKKVKLNPKQCQRDGSSGCVRRHTEGSGAA